MQRPALQNKQVVVLRMAFRAQKVLGIFEKRAPGLFWGLLAGKQTYSVIFLLEFFSPIFVIRYLIANNAIIVVTSDCQFQEGISSHMPYPK